MLLEIIGHDGKSRKADIFDAKVYKDNIDYQFQKKHGFRFVLPFFEKSPFFESKSKTKVKQR